MSVLRVTTWNVLHRVHAMNWNEAPMAAFADERARIAGITDVVAGWLDADDGIVVCLQEVSGDQLASLRRALPRFEVHVHRYPRVPSLRGAGEMTLDDPSEHLVTIARAPSTRVEALTYDTDPGKGLLAVELPSGVLVIGTHVSFGDRAPAQLSMLASVARRAGRGQAVLTGDFNAPAETVRAGLGEPIALSDLAGQGPTRIATTQHGGKTIDHVAVIGGELTAATVIDTGLLSDHRPVTASVRFA